MMGQLSTHRHSLFSVAWRGRYYLCHRW